MNSPMLKACPFCGGEVALQEHEAHTHSDALKRMIPDLPDHPGSWSVDCARCSVGMLHDAREAAIAAWNTRPRPVVDREAVAKVIWSRFAPSHAVDWDDEPNKAEYLQAADAILALIPPDPTVIYVWKLRRSPQ